MDNERINEILNEIKISINNLSNRIDIMEDKLSNKFELKEKDCSIHKSTIDDIKKTIYGNGDKRFSILYRIDSLEKFEVRVTTLAIFGSAIGSIMIDYIKTLWRN